MIRFKCPKCDKGIEVAPEFGGKAGACPGCQETIEIPVLLIANAEPAQLKSEPENAEILWFVRTLADVEIGPINAEELIDRMVRGEYPPKAYARRANSTEWHPITNYIELSRVQSRHSSKPTYHDKQVETAQKKALGIDKVENQRKMRSESRSMGWSLGGTLIVFAAFIAWGSIAANKSEEKKVDSSPSPIKSSVNSGTSSDNSSNRAIERRHSESSTALSAEQIAASVLNRIDSDFAAEARSGNMGRNRLDAVIAFQNNFRRGARLIAVEEIITTQRHKSVNVKFQGQFEWVVRADFELEFGKWVLKSVSY